MMVHYLVPVRFLFKLASARAPNRNRLVAAPRAPQEAAARGETGVTPGCTFLTAEPPKFNEDPALLDFGGKTWHWAKANTTAL